MQGDFNMFQTFRTLAFIFIGLTLYAQAQANRKPCPLRPVNINTATRTELIQIPKIGEKMADRIVQFRKANGSFKRIEEIMNVRGMGEKTFLSIRQHLTAGNQRSDNAKK